MSAPRKIKRTLPGDQTSSNIESMIRVDHAGEYGAKRIYEGQLAVFNQDPRLKRTIQHMAEQEQVHLDFFERELVRRQVRPTALSPLWHVAGYALGAITARMGEEAAMACTVAVETVILEHYQSQLEVLKKNPKEKKLRAAIKKFKAEEEEHHDIGIQHDAEQAVAYPLLIRIIETGARLAIGIAKRI
ncbi:MAG: demethoxyubiquinone hydroxylase family protein [Proteobacteria bacterium]|nr:demethoxyubiquinone hydroxylase family protein [Pseudomonadota bacterium]